MVAISNSAHENLQAYRERMGWSFKWLSSLGNNFNRDYHVSFSPDEIANGKMTYNFSETSFPSSEAPGISVFYRDDNANIFHTYSCYARGLDLLNTAYNHMDLVPKGRDEKGLPHSMSWLRRHDRY